MMASFEMDWHWRLKPLACHEEMHAFSRPPSRVASMSCALMTACLARPRVVLIA